MVNFLLTLATFATGFIVKPFGALIIGRLGDLIRRKYTFLVTTWNIKADSTLVSFKQLGLLGCLFFLSVITAIRSLLGEMTFSDYTTKAP